MENDTTKLLSRLWTDEEGPTAVEYALMLVLVALAIFAATPGISAAVVGVFSRVVSALG
jgi:Flp pilus assembly pilin Flp